MYREKIEPDIVDYSRNPGRELAVNGPVFSLLIRDRGCAIKTGFSDPLKFYFKQKVKDNRTSPQCVYWKTNANSVCNHTDTRADSRSVPQGIKVKVKFVWSVVMSFIFNKCLMRNILTQRKSVD